MLTGINDSDRLTSDASQPHGAVTTQSRIRCPHAQERRRHQRVRVNLLGRYMLADRREYPCQVVNMSPGGMALIAPVSGKSASA